ncbi:GMC family oxidoreductase [Synechococcus sp. CBW1002]|uniref:GMC oxidoreductase n=1 Tax=Synechococcus sp. CBW1002 TaxID=1353134 RepID=UPI0018CF5C9A|nr:GMC family oxidoreductase [Synechococcus sp. CBW1002]QPN61761.1 GMC family oxidoreductase [Synechococcus sp. CBW1002]
MVLAEAGARVLVLEAGPDLSPRQALGSEPANSLRRISSLMAGNQRLQAEHPGYWKANPRLYVDERALPYSTPPDRPFLWSRGRQVGGKSLTWGGITLRLSEAEFRAADRDGHGPCWPIGSRDLDPYYSRLERFLGVHGDRDGLPQLPDGDTRPPLPLTPAERNLGASIGRDLALPLICSRGFALHRPSPEQPWPASSSPGGALARARATGRVQLRSEAVVSHVELDAGGNRAEAVVFLDGRSGNLQRQTARLVVLCASTIETLRILLHSSEEQRSGGLVDPSGTLGHYLMDHISTSRFFSIPDQPAPEGPTELSGAGSCFIPNTVNLPASMKTTALGKTGALAGATDEPPPDFLRGYGLWCAIQRMDPPRPFQRRPGEAVGFLIGHGEVLPQAHNRVSLDPDLRDGFGLPAAHIDCRWGENERRMVDHMHRRIEAAVTSAGGTIRPLDQLYVLPLVEPLVKRGAAFAPGAAPPGYYIHELGGARMAARETDGVVNRWNQCWRAPNLLVVDGACWPTAGWQSPTLTEMAITWRACAAAAERLGRGDEALEA